MPATSSRRRVLGALGAGGAALALGRGEAVGDLKREELVRTGSVVLHEHYFGNLGGDGKASGTARDVIKRAFGSYETWEAEFRRTANALAGGSGARVVRTREAAGAGPDHGRSTPPAQRARRWRRARPNSRPVRPAP